MSAQFPQVRAEWRETDWSPEKRTRFTSLILRLLTEDDDENEE
ncbi:hypothetical protein [Streptomyces sp. NPDC059515]